MSAKEDDEYPKKMGSTTGLYGNSKSSMAQPKKRKNDILTRGHMKAPMQ
jgi:hypothetical protein